MANDYDSSDPLEFLEPSLCIDARAIKHFSCSDIPTNGHEYLFNVMSEARNCPRTVVAKLNRSKINKMQNVYSPSDSLPKIPQEFLPTEDWKNQQIRLFSRLRLKISDIKPSIEILETGGQASSDWWNYIYSDEGRVIRLPLVSAVCCLDQISVINLLQLHSKWLEKNKLDFRIDVASWIFALLACLEIPLDPDTCDCLRSLARYSWNKRTIICKYSGEDGVLLQSLNLLICIIGLFFGQADLADSN